MSLLDFELHRVSLISEFSCSLILVFFMSRFRDPWLMILRSLSCMMFVRMWILICALNHVNWLRNELEILIWKYVARSGMLELACWWWSRLVWSFWKLMCTSVSLGSTHWDFKSTWLFQIIEFFCFYCKFCFVWVSSKEYQVSLF